jgi:5'-3' exonuclease
MGYLSTEIENTGIIFGFLRQIKKFARLYNTNKFVFAWDSKLSKRRELYPGYRVHDLKEMSEQEKEWHNNSYKQFSLIKNFVLPSCNFHNSFKQRGYEADDIIAFVTKEIKDKKIIVSADEDLHQLLNYDTIIFNIRKKIEYTREDFIEEYKIEPNNWVDVKAIGGCTSDKVPGCKGVGEKTALKFLRNEIKSSKTKKQINDYLLTEDAKLYRKLVELPFNGIKEFDVDFSYKFNVRGFLKTCKRFKFNSFTPSYELNEWQKLFLGKIVL